MPIDPVWVVSGLLAIIGAVLGLSVKIILQNLQRQHQENLEQFKTISAEIHTLNTLFLDHIRDHATGAFQARARQGGEPWKP